MLDAKKETIVERVPAARRSRSRICSATRRAWSMAAAARRRCTSSFPAGARRPPAHDRRRSSSTSSRAAPLLYQPGTVWDYGFGLDVLGPDRRAAHRAVARPLPAGERLEAARHDRHALRRSRPTRSRATPRRCRSIRTPAGRSRCASFDEADQVRMRRRLHGLDRERLLRFALMLANKGSYADQRVLGRKTVEYMTVEPARARGA